MAQTNETPADQAGARCDCFAGSSRDPFSPDAVRAQLLASRYLVPRHRAPLIASLAWGSARG